MLVEEVNGEAAPCVGGGEVSREAREGGGGACGEVGGGESAGFKSRGW